MQRDAAAASRLCVERDGIQQLIDRLASDGYQVVGPRVVDGAIVLGAITSVADLPVGVRDEQDAGRYHLAEAGDGRLFAQSSPAQPWKRYFYPPTERLWQARSEGGGFAFTKGAEEGVARYALFGIRACDLTALRTLDLVLGRKGAGDIRYMARRDRGFTVAINCSQSAASCFCASMGSGPRPSGYDLAIGEFVDGEMPRYLITAGSDRGAALLATLDGRPAGEADVAAAEAALEQAAGSQVRSMVPDVAALLQRNLDHRQWSLVAERCLACANCTLVCPTCFCASVEDTTDLSGTVAERWRKWDSCYTSDFSYIHGGSIRRSGASRYRQWITHKLSSWWQQFETSGCVGCGRCITWCPVGIDITQEARTLRESEGGNER